MLSQSLLKELLHYDPDTGIFTWLVNLRMGYHDMGKQAGTTNPDGYRLIRIRGRSYMAHQLAWIYVTGEPAFAEIDHINAIRHDNRFHNLRRATRGQNAIKSMPSAFSGFKGVSSSLSKGRWRSRISVDGKVLYLGMFSSKEAAHDAYCAAAKKYHGEYWRP